MQSSRKGFLAWLRSPLSSARNLDQVIVQQADLLMCMQKQCHLLADLSRQSAESAHLLRDLFPGRGELGWADPRHPGSLFRAQCMRAQNETLDVIKSDMADAVCEIDHRTFLLDALSRAPSQGAVLEFGVFGGTTLRWMSEAAPTRTFFGFDSFRGLPADWTGNRLVDFDMAGKTPDLPQNTQLVIGEFLDTVPKFVKSTPEIALLHIDCDLYESAKVVLDSFGSLLKKGTVLVFDEYFNYPGFAKHEFRALKEFLAASNQNIEWFSYCGERAAGKLC